MPYPPGMPADILTPKQAAKRFGKLKHGPTQTYMHFDDRQTGGVWRREWVGWEFVGYKLYPPDRPSRTFWPRR